MCIYCLYCIRRVKGGIILENKRPGSKYRLAAIGFVTGILNGLFGSGGGMAAVPLLELSGIEPKKSHATSVAVIAVLSLISAVGYFIGGAVDFGLVLPVIPWGLIGALFGSVLLRNINNSLLRRIFGALLIYSAIRIFVK